MVAFAIKSDATVEEGSLTTEALVGVLSHHLRYVVHAPLHYLLCISYVTEKGRREEGGRRKRGGRHTLLSLPTEKIDVSSALN